MTMQFSAYYMFFHNTLKILRGNMEKHWSKARPFSIFSSARLQPGTGEIRVASQQHLV